MTLRCPPHDIEVSFLYDDLSRLNEIRCRNQTVHHLAYDGLGRVVQEEDADGNLRHSSTRTPHAG
ncbi:MAG: RHS repeat protein [Mycobacterium sp.]|nr:RHS repeat protein [Mycobacterium sp.]